MASFSIVPLFTLYPEVITLLVLTCIISELIPVVFDCETERDTEHSFTLIISSLFNE